MHQVSVVVQVQTVTSLDPLIWFSLQLFVEIYSKAAELVNLQEMITSEHRHSLFLRLVRF